MSGKAKSEPVAPATVRLILTDPWCSSLRLPSSDGSTLVLDKQGTDVLAEDAPAYLEAAARHGVTITEVSN